jgi:hypothetical protein
MPKIYSPRAPAGLHTILWNSLISVNQPNRGLLEVRKYGRA